MAALHGPIARLADPERTRRLDAHEKLWLGRQYDGRASFWSTEVPLAERAPAVVDPIARRAGRKLRNLVFGEGHFPALAVKAGVDDVEGLALTDAEAAALTDLLARALEQAGAKQRAREMLDAGLKCGTAVTVCGIRAGRLCVELVPAKWCTPEFDPADPARVVALEVRYRYEGPDPETGRPAHLWYRRVITERQDVTYCPAVARDDGREPVWVADPRQTFAVEFCAVDWHRNLPEPGAPGELDGVPLAADLEGEIECRDFALSQRHRNGRYNGEPQMVLIGARLPAPDGRTAVPRENLGTAEKPSWWVRVGQALGAVKKAPGKVWEIDKEGDAKLLESSGAGATILGNDADDLERVLNSAMGVVDADPATIGAGDLSSKALHLLFADMLGVAGDLRDCWGAALVRVAGTLLRLLATDACAQGRVKLAGARDGCALLRRFYRETDAATMCWFPPPVELTWPPYFEPSAAEVAAATDGALRANGGKPVVSHATSVKLAAAYTGVADARAELAAIQAEEADGQTAARSMFGAFGGGPPHDGNPGASTGQQHPAFRAQQDKMKQAAGSPDAGE